MLHGRAAECAVVDGLLADPHGRTLVVRGEAGIGKSALLDYAAEQADQAERAGNVLRCRGVESEAELPFAAVHQLLRPVADRIDAIPERQRSALLGALGAGDPVHADRFLVSVAILSLLAEIAEERPLLCIVDDAQWLDGASADALTFVARRLEAEPIVLFFGVRDEDGQPFPAPGLPELRLRGLDPASAGALVAERSPVPLTDAVRDLLVAGAAGNPLALVELPASLSAEQLRGLSPVPHQIPLKGDLAQVFRARLDRQPAAVRSLLLVAAADESGELDVLLRAAERLGLDASALDAAEAAGLLQVDGAQVAFRHPLLRSAVYRSATFRQRQAVQRATRRRSRCR